MSTDSSRMKPWLSCTEIAEGVFQYSEPLEFLEPRYGLEGVHSYLVTGKDRAVLIDSGCGIIDLAAAVNQVTELPLTVLNTHAHWDHAGGNYQFSDRLIHAQEHSQVNQPQRPELDPEFSRVSSGLAGLPADFSVQAFRYRPAAATGVLEDGQVLELGGRTVRVIHTPGHSPGHCAFFLNPEGILFTGDTAYKGPVYACFAGGDPEGLRASAWKLAFLEDVRLICPGHQRVIADPRWLNDFAEGVTAAAGGHLQGRDRSGFVVGREFLLRDFSIWLPSG